ncbi:hypothetical protein [Virgibacillus doumboii]|uniref:hypothetical protein n=1 Tax=Virgibacillus doumboii TaxID=2697503 RepID=UPI0013E01DC4|nr:hypothetical protein [Virgibacillus doumboii]
MKVILSLAAVFASLSFLLLHTSSFTTAKVKNEANLSIVSEESALIAINYTKGKRFTVTNNTVKTIHIDRVSVLNGSDQRAINLGKDSSAIKPGGVQEFNITGDPKKLSGKVLRIDTYWNGGSAEIKSTIPDLMENQKGDNK